MRVGGKDIDCVMVTNRERERERPIRFTLYSYIERLVGVVGTGEVFTGRHEKKMKTKKKEKVMHLFITSRIAMCALIQVCVYTSGAMHRLSLCRYICVLGQDIDDDE